MKMITAVIQPFVLSRVIHALERIEGFPGVTVTQVEGFGREKAAHAHAPHARIEDIVDFVKKTRLEIAVSDELSDRVVASLIEHAHTGNPGDGKVFVHELETVVSIRAKAAENREG